MKLAPPIAAGRTNRRARAHSPEIARLHREGYSYAAIQHALADIGVVVSKTTVRREVARIDQMPARSGALVQPIPNRPPSSPPAHPVSRVDRPSPGPPASAPPQSEAQSPRELAKAFINSQITNTLLRNRS